MQIVYSVLGLLSGQLVSENTVKCAKLLLHLELILFMTVLICSFVDVLLKTFIDVGIWLSIFCVFSPTLQALWNSSRTTTEYVLACTGSGSNLNSREEIRDLYNDVRREFICVRVLYISVCCLCLDVRGRSWRHPKILIRYSESQHHFRLFHFWKEKTHDHIWRIEVKGDMMHLLWNWCIVNSTSCFSKYV